MSQGGNSCTREKGAGLKFPKFVKPESSGN